MWLSLGKCWIAGGLLAAGLLTLATRAADEERKLGDTCASAFVLDGVLPISASGTTAGFSNNYDEACPYGESTAPDVVYRYSPASNVTVDVLLCAGLTDFDTKLYIYDSCPPSVGSALACNDDACTSDAGHGFVSALWDLPLQAGATYYIVVDGYGNEAGNYTLTIRESLPPPTCPDDGTTAFGQSPELERWALAFSDYKGGSQGSEIRYENFCGVDERITGIRFWGLGFHFQSAPPEGGPGYWEPCTEDPMAFEITLYEDAGGLPGEEVVVYPVVIPGTLVGHAGYAQFDLYEYFTAFETPLSLRNGSVSIVGNGAPDCWFAWMSSAEGDGRSLSLSDNPSDPWGEWSLDLAFCLTTDNVPVYGACCDECLGCREDVAFSECTGRFTELGCGGLDPACGEVLGACCHADETCQVETCSVCGVWPPCLGDLNCDGQIDLADINPFVLYLSNNVDWQATYPACPPENGDINDDGIYGQWSFDDINPFIALLSEQLLPIPCPGPSGTWLGPGTACTQCPPRTIVAPDGLPYTDTNTTCGRGNSYDATCLGSFDGGEDILYELVVSDTAQDLEIELILDPNDAPYTGLLLTDHFPPDMNCTAMSTNPAATPHSLGCQHLEPGTYYVLVDTWPLPACIPHFQLSVTACMPATGRCCYADWTQCADVTEAACAALGGVWDGAVNCMTPCPPRFREDCAHAEVIQDVPFSLVFFSEAMSADGPVAACDKYRPTGCMQNDAWFAWTAGQSGLATATALGLHDFALAIWADCAAPQALYCADRVSEEGALEVIRFPVAAGTTYYFQIGQVGWHVGGGYTRLELTVAPHSGACCLLSGACEVMSSSDCVAQGGSYQGNDVPCAADPCLTVAGKDCGDPLLIALSMGSLPVTEYNWTTGRGNDYWSTCLGSYDSGEDLLYELAVLETVVVNITLDPLGTPYTGLALADHCPPSSCIAKSISAAADPHGLRYIVLKPGLYYLMVDHWLSPPGIPEFLLTIENADTDSGACCLGAGCAGSVQLAECLNLGGTWHRSEPCSGDTCETMDGDTCLDPLVIELSPYSWYWGGDDTYYRANTYAGTTCLGVYDGGKEVIYKLVVSDTDVCVNITLQPYYWGSFSEPRMALSNTCPPAESCLATPEDWYGTQVFRELVLTPGVYYLMVDTWPHSDWGSLYDYVIFDLWIEPCEP